MIKKSILTFVALFGMLMTCFLVPHQAFAQQRTIVAEEDMVNEGQFFPSKNSHALLYPLGLIALVVIASGGIYMFWDQTRASKPPEPKRKPKAKK